MKHLLRLALLAILASATTDIVRASGPVTVTLSKPANARDAERGVIDVRFRNEGSTPVYLFSPAIPGKAYYINVLCIRDAHGDVAEHKINVGKIIVDAGSFTRLNAHEDIRTTVDLDIIYDLPDGPVDITYTGTGFYDGPGPDGEFGTPTGHITSNHLSTWINRSLLRLPGDHPGWGRQISMNPDCEPTNHAR